MIHTSSTLEVRIAWTLLYWNVSFLNGFERDGFRDSLIRFARFWLTSIKTRICFKRAFTFQLSRRRGPHSLLSAMTINRCTGSEAQLWSYSETSRRASLTPFLDQRLSVSILSEITDRRRK